MNLPDPCLSCGKSRPFQRIRRKILFCSNECKHEYSKSERLRKIADRKQARIEIEKPIELVPIDCQNCGQPVPDDRLRRHSNFCSKSCRDELSSKDKYERWTDKALPTATIGAIGELRTSAELMARGFHVFRALSPACPCDLIAMRDVRTLRVEVRTGTESRSGKLQFADNKQPGRYDVMAVVLPDRIVFIPDNF